MGRYARFLSFLAIAALSFGARAATTLAVNKSGSDIVLSWTSTGAVFGGAGATDGPFANTTTFFVGFGGASYTYTGALANTRQLEFFDVSDETEFNRGGNWNGGVLPPPPPAISTGGATNIGTLFVGSTGTIDGNGFSTVPGNNSVCFKGGVCTQATTASSTQIQFITPPGALSGPVTVSVGNRTSAPENATVTLEDPATGWLIRTIGFSRQDKSYWMAGTSAAVNSLYRVYYDSLTGKWLRENRGGAFSSEVLFCSTQTTRLGQLACGFGTVTITGGGGTRIAQTSPPTNLAACINLGGIGNSTNVRGAAADPNPGAAAGRDVFYFAHADTTALSFRVKKVASDCSTILDTDYGNTNWNGTWNAIVGMAVDPVNGDLYIATGTSIQRITTSETVQVVKTGFTSINGLDVIRGGASDPGVLLVADGGTSNTVKAVPLDNTAATPITVATASALRAAAFGASVSGGTWLSSNVNRVVVLHNNGNSGAVEPLRPYPLVDVTPLGPFRIRISSPLSTEQAPPGQTRVRPSDHNDTSYSQATTELRYQDGLSRNTCAWIGDPGQGLPQYDPNPGTPANCHKPRSIAAGACDNQADLVVGGAGSFTEAGSPLQSCKTCGGAGLPCQWEFRISNRFAGDNYKVYYAFDSAATEFPATSDVYTAWKHIHFERERMCSVGGILFRDYGATGECGGGGQPACCGIGTEPPCNQVVVYDPTNVQQGQTIVVFDEVNSYETAGFTRAVTAVANNGNGSVTLTLDSALPKSYRASQADPSAVPPVPDFRNYHSGGVCVPSGGFQEADLSNLRQGYDDAAVDYHVPTYGLQGAGSVPRLWPAFFDLQNRSCASRRFSQVWYSKFSDAGSIGGCPDGPADPSFENNVFQVIPTSDTSTAGGPAAFTAFEASFTYLYDDQIADNCNASTGNCGAGELPALRNWTVAHEVGHQFLVNACTNVNTPNFGHDGRDAWCGGSGGMCLVSPATDQDCIMNTSVPPSTSQLDMQVDGTDHFCVEDLLLGDPNCPAVSPRQGAIRTVEDPQ